MIAAALLAALLAQGGEGCVARRAVRAADGTALALYRYAPTCGAPSLRRVLLVPDLGHGGQVYGGLAAVLVRRGWTVYVAELRSQGAARRPGFHLADLARLDVPAIAAALQADGAAPFDLVAQGWEGSLALAAAATELRGAVGRVVALSTPVEADVPSRLLEAALRAGGRLSALGTDPEAARIFALIAGGGRTPPEDLARLRASAYSDLGWTASAELLEWMQQGDLPLGDGTTVRGRLAALDRPTLLLLPLADGFAPSELAAPLREYVAGPVALRAFTKAQYDAEDYDHLSLLRGAGARRDVFRPLVAFLEAGR